MKKNKILFTMIFTIVSLPIVAETYTMEIGQFEKMKINGNLQVIYKNLPDSTGFARYEAPAGSKDLFEITVKDNGSLKASPGDDQWSNDNLPVLYLYSNFLTSVESFSDKEVSLLNLAPCASLNITLVGNGTLSVDGIQCNNVSASLSTGNGSIYLSGTAVNANYKMVGTGLISADQLQADNVKCRILGTGSIGCWPIDNLNVVGLGSTKIYYKGSPNIKKTGGGKLFQLPGEETKKVGTEIRSFNREEKDE